MNKTSENSAEGFVVRQPLKLYKSKRRRYVRLEISEPIGYARIDMDRPLSEVDVSKNSGTILNISGGGVLVICEQQVPEGDYIAMSFELKGCEMISGVVGKVKRVDDDGEGGCLMGVEFCRQEDLVEVFGKDNIGAYVSSFDERIKRTLLKYIFTKKVNEKLGKKEKKQ
jgi:c-di-GMP-binding flagellar brake protein YcgR